MIVANCITFDVVRENFHFATSSGKASRNLLMAKKMLNSLMGFGHMCMIKTEYGYLFMFGIHNNRKIHEIECMSHAVFFHCIATK